MIILVDSNLPGFLLMFQGAEVGSHRRFHHFRTKPQPTLDLCYPHSPPVEDCPHPRRSELLVTLLFSCSFMVNAWLLLLQWSWLVPRRNRSAITDQFFAWWERYFVSARRTRSPATEYSDQLCYRSNGSNCGWCASLPFFTVYIRVDEMKTPERTP